MSQFEGDDGADDADDTLLTDLRDSVNYVSHMKCGQSCYKPLDTLIPTDLPTAGGDDGGDHDVADGDCGR